MKILLSWLNEYGDFADPADAARSGAAVGHDVAPRPAGRRRSPRRQRSSHGVVTAEVERLEQHPDAAKVQRVYVDTGDGIAAARVVWRVQHGGRRHRAAGDARHDDARRSHDRAARHPRHRLGGDAVRGRRARPRRRPQRDPDPAAGHAARCAVRRSARSHGRRAARRRRHAQPARLLGLRRHRPRPRGADGDRAPRATTGAGHRRASRARRRSSSSTASGAGVSRARSCRACASDRARRGCSSGSPPPGCARSATSSTSRTT